jgi:hypothetical protein
METLFDSFLRMARNSRRALTEFDANATIRIETRLLSLARDYGTFPFLP